MNNRTSALNVSETIKYNTILEYNLFCFTFNFVKRRKRVCSPVYDGTTSSWRRRYIDELYNMVDVAPMTSFI